MPQIKFSRSLLRTIFLFLAVSFLWVNPAYPTPSTLSQELADHAAEKYTPQTVETLASLVSFPTVHEDGTSNQKNPHFRRMTKFLKQKAKKLGLDFKDHGSVVVIGLGKGPKRVGIITHGDVQPADPAKWKKSPFTLDTESEPGKLLGRGTEDDKGAIAIAMYAMHSLVDRKVSLNRRIELIISYTEESDWDPFMQFLEKNPPPEINVAIDAEYPVVVAEKGFCTVKVTFPAHAPNIEGKDSALVEFQGGRFMTQVPDTAHAIVKNPSEKLIKTLKQKSRKYDEVKFTFATPDNQTLRIETIGKSAHSSTPEDGQNAVAYLSALLSHFTWSDTQPALATRFVHDLVGTGVYGKNFGNLAYSDPFMGPLTAVASYVHIKENALEIGINLRRPIGKSNEEVKNDIETAIDQWKNKNPAGALATVDMYIGEPHYQKDAPHVETLLGIFSHYTKRKDVRAKSMGGGTHARLVPGGVNFGPAMPEKEYTGHSEHEFMTQKQLELNLRMYASMLVELTRN